jgi:hypothetical protein
MTVIVKRDTDRETVVDCGPIEEYERLLEESCADGKGKGDLFRLANSMDREQLRHLVAILTCQVEHYARLWRHSFTPEFADTIGQLRDLRRLANKQGLDLWPELGG